MRVFLYEFITGGGWFDLGTEAPSGSLLQEGRLMAAAVAEDLLAVELLPPNAVSSVDGRVQVCSLLDKRIENFYPEGVQTTLVTSSPSTRQQFTAALKSSDAYSLIVPEFDGLLRRSATVAASYTAKSLSPGLSTLLVAESKVLTAEFLQLRKIPTIETHRALDIYSPVTGVTQQLQSETGFIFKHAEGAGSLGVAYFDELPNEFPEDVEGLSIGNAVIQPRIEGVFASVAAICGPAGYQLLPPMEQRFAEDAFLYRGGRLITDVELAQRAWRLATRVFDALPSANGYVGLDVVLSEQGDFVVEINPRLTTSYIGYRAATDANLAEQILFSVFAEKGHAPEANLPMLPSTWRGIEFEVESGQCKATSETLNTDDLGLDELKSK